MASNIIGGFFLMCFGITIINVGIWVSREMSHLEYDKDARKGVFIGTCVIGMIGYVYYIIGLLRA